MAPPNRVLATATANLYVLQNDEKSALRRLGCAVADGDFQKVCDAVTEINVVMQKQINLVNEILAEVRARTEAPAVAQ